MIKKNKIIYPNFKTSFLNSLNSEIVPLNPPSPIPVDIELIESNQKTIREKLIESFPDLKLIKKMDSLKDLIWVFWENDLNSLISILNGRTLEILKTYDSWEIQGKKEKIPKIFSAFDIDNSGNFNFIENNPSTKWTYLKTNNIFDYNKINNLIVISRIEFFFSEEFKEDADKLMFHWNYENPKIVSITSSTGIEYKHNFFIVINTEDGERKLIQRFDPFIIFGGYTFNKLDLTSNTSYFTFIFHSGDAIYSLSQTKDNDEALILKLIDRFVFQASGLFLSKNIAKSKLNNYPLVIYNNKNKIQFYGQNPITIENDTEYYRHFFYEKENLIFEFIINKLNDSLLIKINCFINPFFSKSEKRYSFQKEFKIAIPDYFSFKGNVSAVVVKENNLNKILLNFDGEKLTDTSYSAKLKFSYSNNLEYDEIPYFFLPVYNSYDFLNQRVKIFDFKDELIGDIDIIANVFTSNSLLYLIKLSQFSTNNVEMKKFDLITNNNNSMLSFDSSITKTRFENKNINLNIVFKNIDNSNKKNLEMKEVSVDTVFAFSQNSSTQEKNIISVNFLKINFVDDSFKIFDFTKNNIGTIENDKFFIKKTILNSSKKIVKSISFHNKNILNEINNPFLNYEINLNPNEVLELSISGELKETI